MDSTNEVHPARSCCYGFFVATFLLNTGRLVKAIELFKECLVPLSNITHAYVREEKVACSVLIHRRLYEGYLLLNDCTTAIEWGRKLLVLLRDSGKRDEEGMISFRLAMIHQDQCKYQEAKELYMEALGIMKETGNKKGVGSCYMNLGTVLFSTGEYAKAKEYQELALTIAKETEDKKLEALCYAYLGIIFQSLNENVKAKECHEQALAITRKIGDRNFEKCCCGILGNGLQTLGEYTEAKKYHEQALRIAKELKDKKFEVLCYDELATVFASLGEFAKTKECLEIALRMANELGDRRIEAMCYNHLGAAMKWTDASRHEVLKKSLLMLKEFGGRMPGTCIFKIGSKASLSNSGCAKAKEYHEKALAIQKELGNRENEVSCYIGLGDACQSLGDDKAKEYYEQALGIAKETGNREKEARCYDKLGSFFESIGDYYMAKQYFKKGLTISKQNGNKLLQLQHYLSLSRILQWEDNFNESISYLLAGIDTIEKIRQHLTDYDQFNISLLDMNGKIFQVLSLSYSVAGHPSQALHALEFGRARALADLLSSQYALENKMSVEPQSCDGIESVMKNERDSVGLYISYFLEMIRFWIVKEDQAIAYREIMNINDCLDKKAPGITVRTLDDLFIDETFRNILPQGRCEDRSWFHSSCDPPKRKPAQQHDENQQAIVTLAECYKLIIAPVAELLDKSDILIFPEGSMFKVPFAALKDASGKHLSETFRIRVVPSFTTLKLIRDSPEDYHSQTGALIVGDPEVGEVLYKGSPEQVSRLPFAREEAKMIGELIGTQPLLGKEATKKAVLQSINSVSLIHFACHGDAERGEIVLAPSPLSRDRKPEEEDYLLKMDEISKVRLRAKLVVLSCCHSAKGEIKTEGVVGIARAFLGSGARSVLVALWAIEDIATKHFMSSFYEHLVSGESASESLHQAMKWMRENGFSDVGQWAPFILIGDNVTLDFGK